MSDFYSNSVYVYLKPASGPARSINSIAMKGEAGNFTSPQFAQFIDSVSVKVSLFRFIEINVTLRPTFQQAVNLIESGLLGMGFDFGGKAPSGSGGEFASKSKSSFSANQLVVKLFSGNRESKFFRGILLMPEFSITQDNIEINLKAVGLLNFTRQMGTTKGVKGETYKTVLERLAEDKSGGYRIEFPSGDKKAEEFLSKPFERNVSQKNWETIKDILRQGNLRLIDNGSEDLNGQVVIRVASVDYIKKQPAKRTFVAFENIEPDQNIFPILSMRTSIVNYAAGQFIKSTVNNISDSDKLTPKDDATSQIGASNTKEFSTGVQSTSRTMPGEHPVDKDAEGKRIKAPMYREGRNDVIDKMKGYFQSLVDTAAAYEITTVGIPDALPGEPSAVRILGSVKFLSGSYDCYELTHTWTQSGAETTFQLFNTFGLASVIDQAIQPIESRVSSSSSSSDQVFKESKKT